MTAYPAIPLAPAAAIDGAETLFVQPPTHYVLRPPGLISFDPVDAGNGRDFLSVVSRPYAPCPAEAVMLYRDAHVLDGSYVISRDGQGVRDSFYNMKPPPALAARQEAQRALITRGDASILPEAGPPVVAIFLQGRNDFAHILAEHLPRLLHLEALGIRQIRLLLPAAAAPFSPVINFALAALGLQAEIISCPEGSVLHVPALHFPTLVGQGWFKSPTVHRLFARLRAAAPPMGRVERLYVASPHAGSRRIVNAAALSALAEAAGYAVVEPSRLDFPRQIALFSGARRVVGPMGAALTLTAAMAPGGQVGMAGSGYVDYLYWDLACLAELTFDWAFAEPLAPFTMDAPTEDVIIPPQMMRRLLEWQTS